MTWELSRHRWSRVIKNKYLFGRIPLLHALVILLEMGLAARLTARFNAYYDQRPVMTMMITNAILGGIADTVAQSITVARQHAVRKTEPSVAPSARAAPLAYEMHELDRKNPLLLDRDLSVPASAALPPPFDFERLTRFMAYGFAMAPLQFRWFKFLSTTFPMTESTALVPAVKRVAFDQLLFAPFGIAAFFTVMTLTEGGDKRAVVQKMRDMYVPTLKANFMVWPAVQMINFRLMPVQFQLPFVSTIGIAWTAYLSLTNAAEDVEQSFQRFPHSTNVRLA